VTLAEIYRGVLGFVDSLMPDPTYEPKPFDVFLLYNHLEIDSIDRIYRALKDQDIHSYLDKYDLPPGANWRQFEQELLARNPVVVLFLGPLGWGKSHRQLAIEIQFGQKSPIIPVLLKGAPPDALEDARGVFRDLKYVEVEPAEPASVIELVAQIRSALNGLPSRTGTVAADDHAQHASGTPPASTVGEGPPASEAPLPSSEFVPIEITTRAVSDSAQSDVLGFSDYADALADLIKNEHTERPITIGISAPWGMGKTRLMRMIQERLVRTDPAGETTRLPTAWFDAWKYDREDSLWAALALEVLTQTRRQIGFWASVKVWVQLNWQRLDRDALARGTFNTALYLILFGVLLALIYPLLLTTLVAKEAAKYVAKAGLLSLYAALLKIVYDIHKRLAIPFDQKIGRYVKRPDYIERVGFIGRFQDDFKKVVSVITGSPANPLVIFIDDLDRCSPSKTAEVLEAINLLLDSERCVFVIGMDAGAVVASVEAKYKEVVTLTKPSDDPGGLTLGQRFLEKIFQIEFRLPPPTNEHMAQYVDSILGAVRPPAAPPIADKQKVAAVKEEIAKKQDAGKSLEEAVRAVGDPGVPEHVMTEAKVERFAESFDSFGVVRDAVRSAASKLGNNPRKVKRFVNAFRLQALIANRRKLLENRVIQLHLLASWLVAETRWPELMSDVLDNPDLVARARYARKIIETYQRDPSPENHATLEVAISDPIVKRLAEAEEALTFIETLRTAAGDRLQDYLHLGRIVGEAKTQLAASA
jgi:hypothetical protein